MGLEQGSLLLQSLKSLLEALISASRDAALPYHLVLGAGVSSRQLQGLSLGLDPSSCHNPYCSNSPSMNVEYTFILCIDCNIFKILCLYLLYT